MSKRRLAVMALGIATALVAFPGLGQDGGSGRVGSKPGTEVSVPQPPVAGRARAAAAYDYYDDPGIVSGIHRPFGPTEVLSSLEKRGFRDIVLVRQRGAAILVEATARHGERVRLVVNARTGGIDGVRVITPPRWRH